jgi:hypothetical protein
MKHPYYKLAQTPMKIIRVFHPTIKYNYLRMKYTCLFLIIIALGISFPNSADGKNKQLTSEKQWTSLSKNYNYTENYKTPNLNKNKPKEHPTTNWLSIFSGLTTLGYVLTGIILLVLIALIIWLVISILHQSGEKLLKGRDILQVKTYENIEQADLEKDLQQMLQAHHFNEALRLQYLMVIQSLTKQKLVVWKKDKTNGNYVNEMYGKQGFDIFRKLTHCFERVWYGDQVLSENDYLQLVPEFKYFNNLVFDREQ